MKPLQRVMPVSLLAVKPAPRAPAREERRPFRTGGSVDRIGCQPGGEKAATQPGKNTQAQDRRTEANDPDDPTHAGHHKGQSAVFAIHPVSVIAIIAAHNGLRP